MAIQRISGRQYPLYGRFDVRFDQVEDGIVYPAMDLPAGAQLVFGWVNKIEAFSAGVDDVITIGDTDDITRYASGITLNNVGLTDFIGTGFIYQNDAELAIRYNGSVVPTVGYAELIIQYVVDGRAQEAQHRL